MQFKLIKKLKDAHVQRTTTPPRTHMKIIATSMSATMFEIVVMTQVSV